MGEAIMAFVIEDDVAESGRFVIEEDEPAVPPAPTLRKRDSSSIVTALGEPALQMVTGLGSSIAGGMRGLYSLASGEGADVAATKVRDVLESGTYQPRTKAGQAVSGAIAYPFEKMSQGGKYVGGGIGEFVGGEQGRLAGESIGEVAPAMALTVASGPAAARGVTSAVEAGKTAMIRGKSSAASAAIEQAQKNAPKLEAINSAQELGIALNPLDTNPTIKAKALVGLTGKSQTDALIANKNESVVAGIARKELGIPETMPLTKESFDLARSQVSGPMNQIGQIASLSDDGAIASVIQELKSRALIGGKAKAKAVGARVDEALNVIKSNPSGKVVLDEISNLRREANSMFASKDLKPKDRAVANTYIGIANAFEDLIGQNLTRAGNSDLLGAYQQARQVMAKSYAWERATDLATGIPNPQYFAKLVGKDNALSGDTLRVGQIAANFPKTMRVGSVPKEDVSAVILRSSIPGAIGAGIGGMLGGAGGAAMGSLGGAALGKAIGMYGERAIPSAAFQAKNIDPKVTGIVSAAPTYGPLPRGEQIGGEMVIPPRPISLAPEGHIQTAKQVVPPQTRGLIGIADEARAARPITVEAYDYQIEPRIGPLYNQRMQKPPETPSVKYSGALPSDDAIIPPAIPSARPSPFPTLPSDIPVLPGERGGMLSLGVGTESARPLPALPPRTPIISLADEEAAVRVGRSYAPEGINFPLRQEVLQRPEIVAATNAFISEANGLKSILENKYIIDRGVKQNARAKLTALEDEFMAGLKQMGIRSESEARNLMRSLYESRGSTQLPIQRTFDPRGMLSGGQP